MESDKFMPISHPFIFISYALVNKSYKVLNLVTKKLLISQEIKFLDNIDIACKKSNMIVVPPTDTKILHKKNYDKVQEFFINQLVCKTMYAT